MKTRVFWLFCLLFALSLGIFAAAREVVIYENNFSSSDLSAFTVRGNLEVKKGRLYTGSSSGMSAYIAYDFPAAFAGCDYRVEVDVYGHNTGGQEGLLIGATSDKLTEAPAYFSGYTCTLISDKTSIAYFNETGWGGTFSTGIGQLTDGGNYHLSVTLRHGILRYVVTSLSDGSYVQSYRFEAGTSSDDIYDTFTSTVGLRKYYNDAYFDDFRVTALFDDLPTSLSGTVCEGDHTLSANLTVGEYTTFFFGMEDEENGYAVTFVPADGRATFFRVENGEFVWMAERALALSTATYPISVTSCDGVLAVEFDDQPFPIFEFPIPNVCGRYAVSGGSLADEVLGKAEATGEETYLNPIPAVTSGADPDMLYYDGTYYLYVYSNKGNELFMLYTSPDLVHFTKRGYVFPWDDSSYFNVTKGSPWSPNVFYNEGDGLFYLTFAAEPVNGNPRTLYYATSTSPYGPFAHSGPLVAIHKGTNEIDGHLYSFGDGKVYISLSRYDNKGDVWLEEVELNNGKITAKTETAARVIVPEAPYENDGVNALCEGGSLFKHGDYYYLLYATGSYARHYGEAYAVATDPLGPYTRADNNPILQYNAFLDGPGDALLVPSPDGSEVWIVYHRHNHVGQCNPRLTCVDRVEFVENPNGGADLLVVRGPSSTPQSIPSFTNRYDPNDDGHTSLADVLHILRRVAADTQYSGRADIDADGTVGVADALILLRRALAQPYFPPEEEEEPAEIPAEEIPVE